MFSLFENIWTSLEKRRREEARQHKWEENGLEIRGKKFFEKNKEA